jgi:hypothetical protein
MKLKIVDQTGFHWLNIYHLKARKKFYNRSGKFCVKICEPFYYAVDPELKI